MSKQESAQTSEQPDLAALLSVDLFKALGDANRLSILAALAVGGRTQTVSEIAECCPINVSVVSRHLKILKQAGVLSSEKRGKEVLYNVRVTHLVGLLRQLANALDSCCSDGECSIRDDDAGTQDTSG